jgi:hypothetical protein
MNENWVRNKLQSCLDYEVPEEMVSFILKIKEEHEMDQLKDIFDLSNEKQALFISELRNKKKRLKIQATQKVVNNPISNLKPKKNEKKQKENKNREVSEEIQNENSTGAKKKQKFYSFYNQDGQANDVILLKGRHRCECQASKHPLINNCLKCGRIVCEQEGSGPCLFCGNLVCSEEELKVIRSQSKKGEKLKKSLMDQNRPKGWEEAISQRDKLLQYDQESERRTTVIDDESDYFKANSVWLSDAERKKLEKLERQMQDKKHESRLTKKTTFDFAGRQVLEEETMTKEAEEEMLRQAAEISESGVHSNAHPSFKLTAPIVFHFLISTYFITIIILFFTV